VAKTARLAESAARCRWYIHIPFCNTLCFYCACNKVITKDRSQSAEYVRYLIKEMAMQAELLGPGQVCRASCTSAAHTDVHER